MPIKYSYQPNDHFIFTQCYGELTIHDIVEYFSNLKRDDTIPSGAAELVDLSEISYFNVDYTEAAGMPASYSPVHSAKQISATILFGSSRLNTGLTRLIEAHFKKSMPAHYFEVVATRNEAIQTLSQARERFSAKEA